MNTSELQKLIDEVMKIDLSTHKIEVEETYDALRDERLAHNLENLQKSLRGMFDNQDKFLDNIIKFIQLYNLNQVRIDVVKDRILRS